MTTDSKVISILEEHLASKGLTPEEIAVTLRSVLKKVDVEQDGFKNEDIDLPEGSILIGYYNKELTQAKASKGQLWVNGKAFNAPSSAAAEATGVEHMSGRVHWQAVYIPRKKGILQIQWLTPKRPYGQK